MAIGSSASLAAAAVRTDIWPVPRLVVSLDGSVSPNALPRGKYVPVTWTVFGKIKTADGTHPDALREAIVDVDKDAKVNAKGYPVCKGSRYGIRDPQAAMRVCGDAVIGKGKAHVEIAFPEQAPIEIASPLTVFNGGEKGGKVKLLIHIFVTVPAPAAVVTEVTITRKGSGLHSVAKIPVIAGGSGSVLDFKFRLGKTYTHKGREVGYFEARCPDGVFKVSMPKLLFKNEAKIPGVASTTVLKGDVAVPCAPQG